MTRRRSPSEPPRVTRPRSTSPSASAVMLGRLTISRSASVDAVGRSVRQVPEQAVLGKGEVEIGQRALDDLRQAGGDAPGTAG